MTGENRMRFHALLAPDVCGAKAAALGLSAMPDKLRALEPVPDLPGWAFCTDVHFGPVWTTIKDGSYFVSIRNDFIEAIEVFDPSEP